MNVKIGSAPDNWGVWFPSEPRQTPWNRFLDELVEAGYEWTELGPYGYLPTDVKVLKSELDKRGLRVSGTFAMGDLADPAHWPEIERQVLGASESLTALGAPFLILIDGTYTDQATGKAVAGTKLDVDGWKRLVDTIHRVADIAHDKFGLRMVFHPHAETHVEYEYQIEMLMDHTDPARVEFCLDTGHHAYRGGDPVRVMRKFHKRIPYLHLKSVDPKVREKVQAEGTALADAVAMDMFCELSKGAVDFAAFRDVLRDVNYDGWAIVEQDMFPAPFDKPLPIAKRNREYLRAVGLG